MSVEFEEYFRKGKYAKVRASRFDSKSEEKVCLILNRLLADYDLEKYMRIRLTPQQALDNYVEVGEQYEYLKNRHKWMKFDFIFEEVYEYNNRMNYVPVAVVEYDGPHHKEDAQKKLDYYKNGIVSNIGAAIVRIEYDKLENLNDTELRRQYEDEIIMAIIKGYFTKTVNHRKGGDLINENNNKKFEYVKDQYEKACGRNPKKAQYYNNMLRLLYSSKELISASSN